MISVRSEQSPDIDFGRLMTSSSADTDFSASPVCMADLVRRLTIAPARLEAALLGLTVAECEQVLLPGEPEIASVVEHVAIYALEWSALFFLAASNVYPTYRGQSSAWKDRLAAEARSGMRPALTVYRKHNKSVAEFLSSLPATDFDRPFTGGGPRSEPFWINIGINWGLVTHCDHHLSTIHKLRTALGKPLDWMAVYLERYPRPN